MKNGACHDRIPGTHSSYLYRKFEFEFVQIYLVSFVVERGFEPVAPPYPIYLCYTDNTRPLLGINKPELRFLTIKKGERPLIQLKETEWLLQNSSKYHG